jgi:ABC-2 type transport system ATP-binding protein
MNNEQNIIQTTNLTHQYGDFVAVKDLNLSIHEGEVFGFLGPNGAGKTTTIRTILDFIRPTSGSASVFGMDSRTGSLSIRGRIGYLPSELTLWENMTGVQYINWLSKVHTQAMMPEAQRLAERLQFDLTRSLKGMSTGMKRKIGLIVTLAHKPELLILDEPTIGLDPLMQKVFHELVLEAKAEGRTVFMSSHSLPEVEQVCDRVGIIRDGELRAVETVANLTKVSFRWMNFTFSEAISSNGFSAIDGVSNFDIKENKIRMKVAGEADVDAILRQAVKHTVVDLSFDNPSLEEIFLSYYGDRSE